jgi:hypothetical protein
MNDLGQILPIGIGAACTVGIVVVGLLMSRKSSSAATGGIADSNPLGGFVFPGVIVLMIGGGIYYAFSPALQELKEAREEFGSDLQSSLQKKHSDIQTMLNRNPIDLPKAPQFNFQPVQLPNVQINPNQFQPRFIPPPPPPQPHIYIDRRGMIHTR